MHEATTQGEALAIADKTTYVMFRAARDTGQTTATWAVMSPLEAANSSHDWQPWQRGQGAPSYLDLTGEAL